MHEDFLHNLREKLQRRVSRLASCSWQRYILALRQFWSFFDSEPILMAVAEELAITFPRAEADAARFELELQRSAMPVFEDEAEWAAVSYFIMRKFAQETDSRNVSKFIPLKSGANFDGYLRVFAEYYIQPFYDYVDERLDDPRFVLAQLVRFKHQAEWFWRTHLYSEWERNTQRGEKVLALKLYEFLHREGVRIHIEPNSVSGEADMVSSQDGPERLVADAKIFNPGKGNGTKYIAQGFRQIYQYACDYNEPIGYLIIFNTSDDQLRFSVRGEGRPIPHVVLNHKTIFFLVIDIYPHEESASERPQQKVFELSEQEILGEVSSE